MDPEEVNIPFHDHPVTPLKDRRRGDCCGIQFEAIYDGYYCIECDQFFHKKCIDSPKSIKFSHNDCEMKFYVDAVGSYSFAVRCKICGEQIVPGIMDYRCVYCSSQMHLDCAKYPPLEIIEVPQNHDHKLKLEMTRSFFTCSACGKYGDGYSYKCHECDDLKFHVSCQKYPPEVNHPCHSLHPLKLFNRKPPAYTDGKCRLCGKNPLDEAYYHCSTCNFTIDFNCLRNPPPLYLDDLNTHDHKLTLMPKSIFFTCTTCGLDGDRSPYICLQCDFTAHNDCSGFPWVININRHYHRVSRTSLLGVVEAVCGICRKKMDWSCGGYSCKRCTDSAFHTKCATRKDVWDGKEMKDEPEEEDEDVEPFKVIDENTILHFIHEEHPLRLDKSGIFLEERYCKACVYPIYHHSFYSCMYCNFLLHESCANMPKRKRHMVSNKPFQLEQESSAGFICEACTVSYNGFGYISDGKRLDLRCASVSEPFFHQSHPEHPLFYTSPQGVCSACNKHASHVLRCVEDNCGYILDFKCALLPYEVKHRVDDHFLSLCYGEEASGKYWFDICEKRTDPKTWFYTCKDCGVTLHIDCVLGDFRGLESGRQIIKMRRYRGVSWTVRNNSMSRPICSRCKSRCVVPIILKVIKDGPDRYACSLKCYSSMWF